MDPLEFINKRQLTTNNGNNPDDDGTDDSWWWSTTAYAIKWAIVGSIFLLFILFVVGGYLHARRRMKKGLAPRRYHRVSSPRSEITMLEFDVLRRYQWMLTRSQRTAFYAAHPHIPNPYPPQQYYYASGPAPAYQMGPYGGAVPPPPPEYRQHEEFVPPYPGKTNPDQRGIAMNVGVQETGTTCESTQQHSTAQPGGDLGSRQA